MTRKGNKYLIMIVTFIVTLTAVKAGMTAELRGTVTTEYRNFIQPPAEEKQGSEFLSLSIEPEFYQSWGDNNQSLTVSPFYRWDAQDNQRTHGDIRELFWLYLSGNYEIVVGISTVFWGVTESQHLVDIINQTDFLENIDGEDKFGQAIISTTMHMDYGSIELYALPFFRERSFPGIIGRLRSIPRVDTNTSAQYESKDKEQHIDWALRWSTNLDVFDIGISYFKGTNREPLLTPLLKADGELVLIPYYALIQQTGLELQSVIGAWLWKLEMIYRDSRSDTYTALTGGFEFTYTGALNSSVDVGLVAEYLYDDRGDKALTPFEDDVMLGIRLSPNDTQNTQFLLAIIKNRDAKGHMSRLEASRRVFDSFTLSIEAGIFVNFKQTDPMYSFRNDDFLQIDMAYHY